MVVGTRLMPLTMLEPLPKVVPQNFPNDREYTHAALIEQLALMELHLRDGSWRLCSCNPEKHLPLLAGLSSEGFGFTDDPDEKEFMRLMRDKARIIRDKIQKGEFNDEDADKLRAWARELRHRIEFKTWRGELKETPELEAVVEEVNALSGGLARLEERHVDDIVTKLCRKWSIPKPRVRFVEDCNPLRDAWEVGRDLIIKRGDGSATRVPLPELDELVFCRGGASPYAVAHETCHYKDRVKQGTTSEESATECALEETRSGLSLENTLNSLSTKTRSGGTMSSVVRKARLVDVAPLLVGVFAGEWVDEAGYIEQYLPVTGYEGITKAAIGGVAIGFGAGQFGKLKGPVKDFALGFGIPLVISGLKQQFMGGTLARARAVAAPAYPWGYPGGLTPYSIPTGLRAGHPTIAVPKIPPRPGMLTPRGMTQYGRPIERSLAGKWMLGGDPIRGGPGSGGSYR